MESELNCYNIDLDYIREDYINTYLNKRTKKDDFKDTHYEKIDFIIEKNEKMQNRICKAIEEFSGLK